MWVCALADADNDAAFGAKAANLARMIRAGLPVPEGVAIDSAAFRATIGEVDPGELTAVGHAIDQAADRIASAPAIAELDARVASLGALAVRSSSTLEDGAAGAGAGVFESARAVSRLDVWPAVQAVWTSALTPLAISYARRRGSPHAMVGVIVQRFVHGTPITVYTRTPREADRVWVQCAGELAEFERTSAEPQVILALAAEAAIGARETGADVELVRDDRAQLWVVQARPIIRAPAPPAREAPPPIVLAALADGRRWTWDVAHNPDPLSPAQAGLVERVAAIAPWAMRVCGGYLYVASEPAPSPRDGHPGDPHALLAAMDAALGAPDEPPGLADALARYVAFYARWAELARYLAATPRTLGSRPSSVEATLRAAARGAISEADAVARLAALAPAWDVAVPTYGEQPELVLAAIARVKRSGGLAAPDAGAASDIADLGERDDLAFARAQQLVRRALLARARELAIDDADACWLPLDDLLADPAASGLDRDTAHRRASAARAAAARAARWDMPIVVGGVAPPLGEPLRGVGHGTRVTGRVVRFASLATAISVARGDVVVTRAVTPALAVLVVGCAAIVSETGGLLDHGAALARELGVPCVVGCHGAWSALADGEIVEVDGDAGTVRRC